MHGMHTLYQRGVMICWLGRLECCVGTSNHTTCCFACCVVVAAFWDICTLQL